MTRRSPPADDAPADDRQEDGDGLRLDKWLWQARFFKTRALAAKIAAKRKVRINRTLVTKAHYRVRPGDVLTFAQGQNIRVVRVVALGIRRGPAPEARTLYEEIIDQPPKGEISAKASNTKEHGRPKETWAPRDRVDQRRARREGIAAKMNGR